MGDTWPFGPPAHMTWQEAYNLIYNFTRRDDVSRIMAAIASAESGLDWMVVNDTPATGDYSCGAWQINYYNGLYNSRVAQFGTPRQLVLSGPGGQARAALAIAFGPGGYTNWSTYNHGEYSSFLHGFVLGPTGGLPGSANQLAPPPSAPAKDWSPWITRTAEFYKSSAQGTFGIANLIRRI